MSQIGIFRQQPTGFKAFIPHPFPSKGLVTWDSNLIQQLSKGDLAIGKLAAVDQLIPDMDFFIYMYLKKEAAHSSQIEGTQATLIDYIKAEAKLTDADTPSDVDEIKNYLQALNYGMQRIKTFPLSWRLIQEIHGKLLKGVRGHHKSPGEFRKSQNWIGGPTIQTAVFVPPPHHEMLQSLSDLEKFFHESSTQLPILIKAGLIHAQFETIHPFLDGNGRIGRLLIILYLYKEGILPRPLLYLSEYFKINRKDYYDKLDRYRQNGGVNQWLLFFLEGIRFVAEEAVVTAQRITQLREKHLESVSHFGRNSQTALKLLNKLYSQPLVDAKAVAKITGISSKANVSNLIEKFVNAEILFEITGKERNRRFLYKHYLDQFKEHASE
jgi:Fic family protein